LKANDGSIARHSLQCGHHKATVEEFGPGIPVSVKGKSGEGNVHGGFQEYL